MVDFGDYKNILRPPPLLVCKLMQLTKAFLSHQYSNPLLLDQLDVNSIQQLHKQSGPEAASHNSVDEI